MKFNEFASDGKLVAIVEFETTEAACKHYAAKVENDSWNGYWQDADLADYLGL